MEDAKLAACEFYGCADRAGFSGIFGVFAIYHLGMFSGEFAQIFAGSVGGTVVDDDDLALERRGEFSAKHLLNQGTNKRPFVVNRDQDTQ